jgi:hypothetical protein
MKFFGREPAAVIGLIGAAVTFLVSIGLPFLNAGQGAAVVAFVTALLVAYYTRPVTPAVATGFIGAGAALFYEYGLHLNDAQVGGFTSLVLAAMAVWTIRPQVSPRPSAS